MSSASISQTENIRSSGALPRRFSMPDVPGAKSISPMMFDRFGEVARRAWPLALAVPAVGAVAGAKLLSSTLLGRVGGGVAGLMAGVAATVAGQTLLDRDQKPAAGGGLPPVDVDAEPERMRVMSFNIRNAMGRDSLGSSPAELEAIAAAIEREKPDIVLLQEVGDFSMHSSFRDVFADINERLKPTGAAWSGAQRLVTGKAEGTAVLTFNGYTVDNARNIRLSSPGGDSGLDRVLGNIGSALRFFDFEPGEAFSRYNPRNATDTIIRTPAGNAVRALSTHLSGRAHRESQRLQLDPLAASTATWRGPTLLGGDFNIPSASKMGAHERRRLGESGLRDAFEAIGIPPSDARRESFPNRGIDYGSIDRIYASQHFDVHDVRVLKDARISDHRPLVADVTLN